VKLKDLTDFASSSPDLLRRKQVCLRARPNLHINYRSQGGRRICIIKDPVSLGYFHLEEAQAFALANMDGKNTLEDIRQGFEKEYRPQRLTLEELEAFASQLIQSGLVENPAVSGGAYLYGRHEKQQRQQRWARLNLFYIKVPLAGPDRLLAKLLPLGRLLFHPFFVLAALVAFAAALGSVLTRWGQFWDQLPTYQEFFLGQNLLYLWLTLGVVKILHELGHGLCSKVVGGEVHEMGVVFLFFFPTLYCNVTDSWTLPEKWKRMAISAAGIYMELLIATGAVFSWWLSDPNTLVNNICFNLILVCTVHTLAFNANPLMRFDGYFILSDWAEVPNLAQASARRLLTGFLAWLGIATPGDSQDGKLWLLLYALASLVYRWLITITVCWGLYLFLKEYRLQWLGLSIVVFALVSLLALPVVNLIRGVKKRGRFPDMKSSRVLFTAGFAVALVAVVYSVPLPMKVRGLALVQVEPDRQQRLVIPGPGGFLDQVFVRDGHYVRKGDVLAMLHNPDLEKKLHLNETEQSLRLQQRHVLVSQMASLVPLATESETHEELTHSLTILAQEQQALKVQKERLVLRAPCDGVLLSFSSWEMKGKWLAEGEPYCVADDACLRAAVLVDPADRQLLQEGAKASFLAHGGPVTDAQVSEIAQVDEKAIPPQLSGRIGGEVATKQDPVTKTEQPFKQHFLVTVRFKEGNKEFQVGTLGRVRIEAGSSTLWWRLQRWLGSTLNLWAP
jgi:putative peptide zinc metalloprotease protein